MPPTSSGHISRAGHNDKPMFGGSQPPGQPKHAQGNIAQEAPDNETARAQKGNTQRRAKGAIGCTCECKGPSASTDYVMHLLNVCITCMLIVCIVRWDYISLHACEHCMIVSCSNRDDSLGSQVSNFGYTFKTV